MKFVTLLLLPSLCSVGVFSQTKCSDKQTCGECIGFANDDCVWCSEPDMNEKRCQSAKEIEKRSGKTNRLWCKSAEKRIEYKINHIDSGDFQVGTNNKEPIQFKPQTINVTAHPGERVQFTMSYKPAKDFPLDIYYLMDYSFTMKEHMKVLRDQGTQLYTTLKKFTNNVRFGAGGFIEKPGLPYADPAEQIAYSFKHFVSMTDNIAEFQKVLSGQRKGSNYDDPEAGLDALMQVMACEKDINWRRDARRIIILCTDSTYHSAGDGKIVGAVIPNDMKCHLNGSGVYDADLIFDYPSVSQINKMATDGKFLIIFAALNTVEDEYTALASAIRGAKYAVLAEKSNIIEIIKDAYLKSIRFMELLVSNLPSNIELSIEPDCTKSGVCEVVHNKVLEMKAVVKVTSCEKVPLMILSPMGINDRLTINLDVDCECTCEKAKGEKNSAKCSSAGTYQCGVCKCNDGSYGDMCQCSGNSTIFTDIEKCKANDTDIVYCSGRGTCNCGKCQNCTGYSGDFCEFDDNACVRVNNKLCSDHGKCHLGKCECDLGWKGSDCTCPDHNFDCIAPYSKEICSGSGRCDCGKCICTKRDSKNELHGGAFCNICYDCADKRCKELEDYVHCNFKNNNKTFCDIQYNEINTNVVMLNQTDMKSPKYVGDWCRKQLDDGTVIVFKHQYKDNKLHLFIQKEVEVPPKANIWVAVGSAIGVVLLIGLLTIIAWKILVDMHDAKEYEKFSSEAKAAGFIVAQNPWYIPPAHNFSNPTFEE